MPMQLEQDHQWTTLLTTTEVQLQEGGTQGVDLPSREVVEEWGGITPTIKAIEMTPTTKIMTGKDLLKGYLQEQEDPQEEPEENHQTDRKTDQVTETAEMG